MPIVSVRMCISIDILNISIFFLYNVVSFFIILPCALTMTRTIDFNEQECEFSEKYIQLL